MSQTRLNGLIRAFESGKPAFAAFSKLDRQTAIDMSESPYDGLVFEMEHNPYDVTALGDALQYLLNRKAIASSGSIAPSVTPLARIPANGAEMNQAFAKQVLDRGVYGVIWPHVSTVEQAYNAVASCRYARPKNASLYEPKGVRGDGPANASRYWGLTIAEYYKKADVWPLAPEGEILVGLMCESTEAIENLDDILTNVPGIGFIMIGEGDLSQELGCPRDYDNPIVVDAMRRIVDTCKRHDVVVAHPHVSAKNHKRVLEEGYGLLLSAPMRSYGVVGMAREAAGY
ncbi:MULTISPECIES: HpcH/HpaI aldolase family protein [Burkholderia]|jgi:4-hydroxy-2-oxoheptanedioate aldolase|uniref:Aldolase n=2 Tax=Burkholderia multivorans TaxID=87883 RepID=A0A1B4N2J1_9BURK|nr:MULTISPECIES: aldolase/citrate lyase family protein [Burkholderia]AIO72126.1 hpcH/HpaI aldolase/citrate lyase family protein [Burkholderia multivorans]AJY15570.1 hpcH/HpaI aldolase/citrate lyase family protein [Burkholderia multivorans ATCC BAA-247]AOJ95903.1 aldolase [Burkholderia multivorans]AOK64720.1 aldolase [Burkholderia multivorans]AVR19515.1 aldolase [Burkholderia multivorans]